MPLSTEWVAPGNGATVAELISRMPNDSSIKWDGIYASFRGLGGKLFRPTSLAIRSSEPFQEYDVERAVEALRRIAEEK